MEVSIENISKKFGRNMVLEQISLKASPGEILCLLGPSGAGKTTLIRLILGAIRADEGTITIDGKPVPDFDLIRHIGYMPQDDAVYHDLSGYGNLSFFAGLYGQKGAHAKRVIEEMLELVGLAQDKDKLVANYSGGMKKRLSLAIALLHDPDVLLLDEPTVGIDPVLRKAIWSEFNKQCDRGKTIIISTHVMDEAVKCRKAALLYQGRLLLHDTVEALVSKTASGNIEDLFFAMQKDGGRI